MFLVRVFRWKRENSVHYTYNSHEYYVRMDKTNAVLWRDKGDRLYNSKVIRMLVEVE